MTNTPDIPPRRPLTLRDVSEASGVSEMTVSRVLRNRGDVSAATREKVLTAAKTLGYVPNKIAGGLASQRVNLVAVVIPSLSNLVFPDVLGGISAELDDTGLQPVIGVTNYSPAREEMVLYDMLSWRPSGVILAGLAAYGVVATALLWLLDKRLLGYEAVVSDESLVAMVALLLLMLRLGLGLGLGLGSA